MSSLHALAIIVPIASAQEDFSNLVGDLTPLHGKADFLLVGPEEPNERAPFLQWISSPRGRARQMNTGARSAKKRFLWFLHADSRVPIETLTALERSLNQYPGALHYFDLEFHGGPLLMKINTFGVWFRSHWLKIPFGDQGFVIERTLFEKIGGFDESAPYGEDHLWVWKLRRAGISLHCVGASLSTSARKYTRNGWLATTGNHLKLTFRQAIPEAIKMVRGEK